MLCKCKVLITTPVFLSSEPMASGMELVHWLTKLLNTHFLPLEEQLALPLFSFSSPFSSLFAQMQGSDCLSSFSLQIVS